MELLDVRPGSVFIRKGKSRAGYDTHTKSQDEAMSEMPVQLSLKKEGHEASSTAGYTSDSDQSSLSSQQAEEMAPSIPLNATTPVTNLYLTFDTELPTAHFSTSVTHPDTTLPPCPDLSAYGDPTQMPNARKNIMLLLCCVATCLTAYTAGAYSPPAALLAAEFGVSRTAVLLGITMFTCGFAIAPMVLAPFSEVNGRYPVFVVSGVLFVIFQAVCGLVTNLSGMLVARFLCGVGGSVFSTMIGGVIADLWPKEERNTPMALYSGAVLVGTGLGPLSASLMSFRWGGDGVVGLAAPWRWVFWHQVILDGVLVVALVILFSESRGSVLLSRKARKLNSWYENLERRGCFGVWIRDASNMSLRTSTQAPTTAASEEKDDSSGRSSDGQGMMTSGFRLQRIRWLVKEDEQRATLVTMVTVSLVRPFHLLFTEPAVFFFSLWVSFAWAVLYLTFGSVPFVFTTQYHFNQEQTGLVFLTMVIGSMLATAMGVYQERLLKYPRWQGKAAADDSSSGFWSFMRRRFPVEAPESRLYFTCLTSIFLPAGLFLFGFSAQPSIHWIVPATAIALATAGIYTVYLATFNYLADSYQTYASSALAAQSFCRNMLGGAFPLIVGPLFVNLGEDAAGGLLGGIATLLTIVPWVLAFFGEAIRSRSRFAVALARGQS